jgi:hypothetical protein
VRRGVEKSGAKFDYDKKIEGITLIDKYTISFKLRSPDYNFIYFFAIPNVVLVAREVMEKYRDDTMAHPVGTGPYVLPKNGCVPPRLCLSAIPTIVDTRLTPILPMPMTLGIATPSSRSRAKRYRL